MNATHVQRELEQIVAWQFQPNTTAPVWCVHTLKNAGGAHFCNAELGATALSAGDWILATPAGKAVMVLDNAAFQRQFKPLPL